MGDENSTWGCKAELLCMKGQGGKAKESAEMPLFWESFMSSAVTTGIPSRNSVRLSEPYSPTHRRFSQPLQGIVKRERERERKRERKRESLVPEFMNQRRISTKLPYDM